MKSQGMLKSLKKNSMLWDWDQVQWRTLMFQKASWLNLKLIAKEQNWPDQWAQTPTKTITLWE